MDEKTSLQAQILSNRLEKRFRHLKKWAQRTGAGVFRLYDRDIPEIPLVLDFYGDCSDLTEAARRSNCAVSGALYKRPYEKDEDDEDQWLSAMKESISISLGIPPERVFLKQRQKQKGASQYEKVSDTRFEKIVREGASLEASASKEADAFKSASGLSFKINLSDYLDTGLFPDRRLLRAMVRDASLGKKVLNLFSYTGSFSVYAAAGGAISTDSVDLSNTYLNWARENFSLNGYSAVNTNSSRRGASNLRFATQRRAKEEKVFITNEIINKHQLIRANVIEFLNEAISAKMQWDIIIVDPPAFSNSKKMNEDFDLNRDIIDLLSQCLKLLSPDGKIFTSVNVKRGTPSAAEIEDALNRLSSVNVRVTDITDKIIDEDFKGRKIPKAFLIERA